MKSYETHQSGEREMVENIINKVKSRSPKKDKNPAKSGVAKNLQI